MIPSKRLRAATLVSVAAIVAATGCSTKAPSTDGGSAAGGAAAGSVKTGRGVSGTTIKLGVLTDLTGVFAALGKDITNAQTLYWQKQNAGDKVCGKYTVDLNIKDHGYVTQQGVQLYSAIHNDVLAIQHTIGSPINTALAPGLEQDKMVNFPAAWAQSLTTNPENAVVGATYEIEMINVLDYLLKEGKIKEGDKIGHIYFEGEYGAGGLAGSKYFASKHGMTVVESKIKSTDTDMSAQITNLKAQGVAAIALTVAPDPDRLGRRSSPPRRAWTCRSPATTRSSPPACSRARPAASLQKNLYVASPISTFDKNPDLLKEYQAKYPGDTTLGVVFGTASADVMKQILDKACKSRRPHP